MGIFKLVHMKEAKGKNKSQRLKNAIYYIFNPAKTEENLYIGGIHCPTISSEAAYNKMVRTKERYGKTDGRQGYHFILSFAEREHVSAELCQKITQEVIERLFDDYETVFAVHTDQKHMHSHIVFNSVSFRTGIKYHYAKGEWRELMMPVINEICRKYGLEELDLEDRITDENRTENSGQNLDHSEQQARKAGRYTELQHIQMDIDDAIEQAESYEQFLNILRAMGYRLRDGAEKSVHLSLIPPGSDREKFMRTDRLGEAYMPAGIKKRISGEWQIPAYDNPYIHDKDGEADFDSYRVKRNQVSIIRIRVARVRVKKQDYRHMTRFQRSYLRYYRYFDRLQHSYSGASNWNNNADILASHGMAGVIAYMIANNIKTYADVEKLKKSKNGRRMAYKIEQMFPLVMKWTKKRNIKKD